MIRRYVVMLALGLLMLGFVVSGGPATGSPADDYVRAGFGDGNLPAGCIVDRDPLNPDNECFHMKVGLNALDSPKVDVAVLVPVSPFAERDMRVAEQAVLMWAGGLDYLAGEMGMDWLEQGVDMNVTTHQLKVDPTGALAEPLALVDPEVVVIVSNPAGGIGIGIDPVSFAGELGIVNGEGTPCLSVPNALSLSAWQGKARFDQHGRENGGTYVEDCGGIGGNVCFAVNGAVDPLPGESDFFGLFDLVAHEVGHCLTLGHVGDGADGPWGPTAPNDIMAYSTDPPGLAKCVSTLNVEGFALRMSRYLDVTGDGTVDERDRLEPNDVVGDGFNSFQVQNPADHHYASATGSPGDCPQPRQGVATPGQVGRWTPKPVATTKARIQNTSLRVRNDRISVRGTARNLPLGKAPTKRSASATDATADTVVPFTDLTGVRVSVNRTHVRATMSVSQVWPIAPGGSATAYSLLVNGRRFDSFIGTGSLGDPVMVMDNGTGYYLPKGTATWNVSKGTVTFAVPRDYLADQFIEAPYTVNAVTGIHLRSNDWVRTTDSAPDGAGLRLAAPPMGPETRDAPVATKVKTSRATLTEPGGTMLLPTDSTLGVGLVSAVDTRDYYRLPIKQQATATVTLTWTGASILALSVNGGSRQVVKEDDSSITVTVPWARRDLAITVDPQEVLEPTFYTVTTKVTTVRADRDGDSVPDVADRCRNSPGPSTGAGCPDTDSDGLFDGKDRCKRTPSVSATGCPTRADEQMVLTIDGKLVTSRAIVTRHGAGAFAFSAPIRPGSHKVVLSWLRDGAVISRLVRNVSVRRN